jgi:hypothetical protein
MYYVSILWSKTSFLTDCVTLTLYALLNVFISSFTGFHNTLAGFSLLILEVLRSHARKGSYLYLTNCRLFIMTKIMNSICCEYNIFVVGFLFFLCW